MRRLIESLAMNSRLDKVGAKIKWIRPTHLDALIDRIRDAEPDASDESLYDMLVDSVREQSKSFDDFSAADKKIVMAYITAGR